MKVWAHCFAQIRDYVSTDLALGTGSREAKDRLVGGLGILDR